MTSDLPAGDVIVLHDDNGRHAYHALTLAMVALDALSTDQSSRALGCAQGARYGCPKAAASSLEQIVSTKAGSFTHPKEMPDLHTGGLRVDSGAARSRKGARAGQRVDRRGSYASVGPEWEIQEVSRVGAQGVTSKSIQVEASGPGNARPAHWRLAGRFRRGEVAEGCAGGAAGRSKGLICLRGT